MIRDGNNSGCAKVGGGGGVSSSMNREKARRLIKTHFKLAFAMSPEDCLAMTATLRNSKSYAIFVLRGSAKPTKTKRTGKQLPQHEKSNSLFHLTDGDGPSTLECIAAINLTCGTNHQFVHWLAVRDKASGSKFAS